MRNIEQVLEQMSLAIAYMVQNQNDFTDAQALQVKAIYPEWHVGVDYRVDQIARYDMDIYRCVSNHLSQADWTPDASPSLWSKIVIDEETGYEVWLQPTGMHDAYNVGDVVMYNDEMWVSIVNNNTWEPGVYGWEKQQIEE